MNHAINAMSNTYSTGGMSGGASPSVMTSAQQAAINSGMASMSGVMSNAMSNAMSGGAMSGGNVGTTISSTMVGSQQMGERVQSTRKVSSTIVAEQYLGYVPSDMPVREVEVQGPVQEVVTHVPKKQVVEIEKKVPKIEYEWVEKIVEVPRVEWVDRQVEVPRYQEVIREVKVPQIIDQPREVIKEVKVPKINYVEQIKEVPGQVIEVPKPYTVEEQIQVTRYNDKSVPFIVAQTIKPIIVEGTGTVDVDVFAYEPECVPVDIHVLKPITAQIQNNGPVETTHKIITIPAAQYNTMLQQLNVHLTQAEVQKLPYLQSAAGRVEFLGDRVHYTPVPSNVIITGFDMSRNNVNTHIGERVNLTTGQVLGGSTTTTTVTQSAFQNYGGSGAAYGGSGAAYGGSGAAYGATSYGAMGGTYATSFPAVTSGTYTGQSGAAGVSGAGYSTSYPVTTTTHSYSSSPISTTKQTTTTTTTRAAQPIMA